MSPLAAVALAREQGVATVVHVSCRDRNRLALRSQVIGAAAPGSEGILCLYGDRRRTCPGCATTPPPGCWPTPRGGPSPTTRPSAASPTRSSLDVEAELALLGRKAAAGADFVQTQMVFDPAGLAASWSRRPRAASWATAGSTPASR